MTSDVGTAKIKYLNRSILCESLVRGRKESKQSRQSPSETVPGHNQLIVLSDTFDAIFVSQVRNFVVLGCTSVLPNSKQVLIKAAVQINLLGFLRKRLSDGIMHSLDRKVKSFGPILLSDGSSEYYQESFFGRIDGQRVGQVLRRVPSRVRREKRATVRRYTPLIIDP